MLRAMLQKHDDQELRPSSSVASEKRHCRSSRPAAPASAHTPSDMLHLHQQQQDPRDSLLRSLKGRKVVVPDLEHVLGHWPSETNPELPALRQAVDAKLTQLFSNNASRLAKMRAADAAGFAAQWWPYASYERLLIATFLSIWLFVWDDETDSVEFSSLATDFAKAQAFRTETVGLIRHCLSDDHPTDTFPTSHPVVEDFEAVGKAIAKEYDADQKRRLLEELELFVKMTELEQRYQLLGILPTPEEYAYRRMGSSAVGVCLAISEYALETDLPQDMRDDEDIEILRHETNTIISVVNDMLSVKKEVAQRQLDSLLPLLFARLGSIQTAMDKAGLMVSASVAEFDAARQRLEERLAEDPDRRSRVRQFAESCMLASTANLRWSLTSGRYRLGQASLSGGLVLSL